jgi:hypothetical protein
MSIQIEKGIPLPPASGPMPLVQRELMEVGDSYFMPGEVAANERNRAHAWSRYHPGFKFCVRKVEGGVRVWRIK